MLFILFVVNQVFRTLAVTHETLTDKDLCNDSILFYLFSLVICEI